MIPAFPYQDDGILHLSIRDDALLGDEPGLGKSMQCVRALDEFDEPALVLCPASARQNWVREVGKFSAHNPPAQALFTGADAINPATRILVCSYDMAAKPGVLARLKAFEPKTLVCDEIHFCKEPTSQRAKATMGKEGLAHLVKRRWLVSGTVMPNHAAELWVILRTAGRTALDYDDFVQRYCLTRHTPFGDKIVGTRADMVPELRRLLAGYMLRRKKDDVMKDLPKITFGDIAVQPGKVKFDDELTRADVEMQTRLVSALLEGLGSQDSAEALAAFSNSALSLRQYTGLQKVEGCLEWLRDELDSGVEKIVVFAIHKRVIAQLRDGLKDYNPVVLDGSTTAKARDAVVQKFQNDKDCRVFIGNLHAAGTAITLTAAHNVLFVEWDWVPANNAQPAMRVHRIGQKKPVLIRFAIIPGSLDETIQAVVRRKTKDICAVLD